jgi:hypothetical protein
MHALLYAEEFEYAGNARRRSSRRGGDIIMAEFPSHVWPMVAVPRLASGWIISKREDLIWFQGSVVAGLALLLFFRWAPRLDDANYSAGHPAVIGLLLWGVLFDGTHVWGTYARSYLADDSTSQSGLPSRWWWGLLLVGPALAVLDHLLCTPGPSQMAQAGWLFRSFLLTAYLWAYWHLVRQHYGFVVLYRRKERDSSQRRPLDVLLLWGGAIYPYLRFSLSDAYRQSGMPQTVPLAWTAPLTHLVDFGFGLFLLVLLIAWLASPAEERQLGPRHLLVAVVVLFHIAVFALLDNLLTITATLTIFHNLQYHRIVWQYERGHGRVPSRSIVRYLAFGIALGVVWYGPRLIGLAVAEADLLRNVLLGVGWGVAFHHYLVDGRIWRVRRSPGVASALDAGAIARS